MEPLPLGRFGADQRGNYTDVGIVNSGPQIGFYSELQIHQASHRGTISNQYCFRGYAGINSCGAGGTVTNAYGLHLEMLNNDSDGTVTNSYGVYINDTDTAGASTNRYGIYSEGSATKNYFEGNIGVGVVNPTYAFETNAGNGIKLSQATAAISIGSSWGDGVLNLKNGVTVFTSFDVPNAKIVNNLGKYLTASSTVAQFGTQDGYDATFVVSGVEKMRIDTDGNVGIGTTAPNLGSAKGLHIYSSAAAMVCQSTSSANSVLDIRADGIGDPQIFFDLAGATPFSIGVDNSDGDKFKISANYQLGTSDRLVIDSAGNVGIGTDAPNAAYKLHVHGLAYATGAVIGNSYAGQSPPSNGLVVEGNVGIGYYAATNKLGVYGNANVGSSYQSIAAPSNGLIVEGDVGIGNSAPQAELDVSGAIKGGFSLSAKSADFTLGVGDNGGFINGTSASFDQITISSDLGADFNVAVMNTGANVVITGSSSMIINGTVDGGVTLASGYQPASIVRLATNTYAVFGNLS